MTRATLNVIVTAKGVTIAQGNGTYIPSQEVGWNWECDKCVETRTSPRIQIPASNIPPPGTPVEVEVTFSTGGTKRFKSTLCSGPMGSGTVEVEIPEVIFKGQK